MPRTALTDAMWEKLEPLLPSERGGMGRSRLPNRPMVEAILWKHRTGAPWRGLPEVFGTGGTRLHHGLAQTLMGMTQAKGKFLAPN